jgi:CRISPR/Cas system-associated exonuclease Cas4 (RecB family)
MAKALAKKILNKKGKTVFDDIEKFDEQNTYQPIEEHEENFPGLVDKIYNAYLEGKIEDNRKKKSFSPSKIVWNEGVCPRFWYLAFKDGKFINKYDSGKNIANMENGTAAHERIQSALETSGIQVGSEEWVKCEDPPIVGKLDSRIEWEDKDFLVEIKTCTEEAFQRHKKNNSASNYHVLQLLIYMKILKKKYGMILYENKNSQDILVIPVNITQKHVDFVDYLFDWMREVHSAIEEEKLPEVPFRSNDIKICQKCALQEVCKTYPKGDIKIARRKDEKGEF